MKIKCKPDSRPNPFDTTYEKGAVFALSDGKIIYASQQAYLEGTDEEPYYRAAGYLSTDDVAHSATVEIIWIQYPEYKDHEDASDHCNWDKPVSITHYALGELI